MNTTFHTNADATASPVDESTTPSRSALHARWLIVLGAGPAILLALKLFPWLDAPSLQSRLSYVLIAGETALVGMALALVILRVAHRSRDGRLFLIGMGFLSAASLCFISFRLGPPEAADHWRAQATSWSTLMSLVFAAVFFGLSGIELSAAVNQRLMKHAGLWAIIYLGFWLIFGWIYLMLAQLAVHAGSWQAPSWLATVRFIITAAGITGYTFAALRHYQLYQRCPSGAGLAMIAGIVLCGEALLTHQLSQIYTASFWLYHVLQATAFAVVSVAVLSAYHRGQSDEGLLESVFLAVTRRRLQADYGRAMEALIDTFADGVVLAPGLRQLLQSDFGLTAAQVAVVERTAQIVAVEQQQRATVERLNASLIEAERCKDQLVQMIVHDLKNPLTAQIGFLEILERQPLSDYQQMLIAQAVRSGRRLSDLIDDLLDVAGLERGTVPLERAPVAVSDLLESCAEELAAWISVEGKTLQVVVLRGLPLVSADPRLMRRVILNLLSNALKHTPPGTRITLQAAGEQRNSAIGDRAPARVIIEVSDTGPGIPPEHLEQIFDRFGQPAAGGQSRQRSTGIGLAFCRQAVEAQGGTISVTSVVGQGTTFRVTLPICE